MAAVGSNLNPPEPAQYKGNLSPFLSYISIFFPVVVSLCNTFADNSIRLVVTTSSNTLEVHFTRNTSNTSNDELYFQTYSKYSIFAPSLVPILQPDAPKQIFRTDSPDNPIMGTLSQYLTDISTGAVTCTPEVSYFNLPIIFPSSFKDALIIIANVLLALRDQFLLGFNFNFHPSNVILYQDGTIRVALRTYGSQDLYNDTWFALHPY